jgi:division protein CdvB (Snf7/Vps24/ESCRT-III family)
VQALERRMARVSLARDRMAAALAKLPEAPRTREQRTQRAEIVRDMADADRALTELRAQARALQASR